jgi:hypothetical protein
LGSEEHLLHQNLFSLQGLAHSLDLLSPAVTFGFCRNAAVAAAAAVAAESAAAAAAYSAAAAAAESAAVAAAFVCLHWLVTMTTFGG